MKRPANHEPKYSHSLYTSEHKVDCLRCGESSDWLPSKQLCEDWWYQHLAKIERVKAHLSTATPSLKGQAAYYRSKADDTTESPEHRLQWATLATELEHRLGIGTTTVQEMLPGMP